MSVNFFKDIQLKQSEVSGNYRLHKIGQLYDELQQFESPFSQTNIESPLDIAGDDVCMWIDPSNPALLNLDANNNLVNNVNGFAVADKSQYANNYAVVAGGAGLSYDPLKGMIKHVGGAVNSALERIGLGSKNPNQFSTTNSPFAYFCVVEPNESIDFGGGNTFRAVFQMGQADSNRPSTILTNTDTFASGGGGIWQNTRVANPTTSTTNYMLGKKHIICWVYGMVGGQPYKDLYYNGIFCSRSIGILGVGSRSTTFNFGSWQTNISNVRWEGWSGEQILISRELNRSEVIKMFNYLNSKWNVYPVRECDIFVTAGQSNMVGRGNGTLPNPTYTNIQSNGTDKGYYCSPDIPLFNPQAGYYTASETPIACHRGLNGGQISFWQPSNNTSTPNNTIVAVSASNSIGSDRSDCLAEFANEYFKKTGRYAVFFKCAVGGTSLFNDNEWSPYQINSNLWKNVRDSLPVIKEKLRNNGWNVKSASLLWHQGESDAGSNQAQYLTRLTDCFNLVINNFGYDNVFYYIVADAGASRNAQLQYNPSNSKIVSIFDTRLLSPTRLNLVNNLDTVHFNTLGQQMMGIEGGKQVGEIIAKDQTLTLKSVVSVEQPTTIYSREDVRYWGAVGNGINDDTQAIQLAFSNNSRRVYIPSGTYLITGNTNPLILQNKTNFTLELDGCIFSYTGTGANSNMLSLLTNINLVVKGNAFFRQTTNGANSAVRIQNCFNSVFRGFNIQGFNNFTGSAINQFVNGILVLTGSNTQNANTITECNIRNCQTGISLQAEYYTISNCIITQCSWYGIRVASSGGNFGIDNCNLQANGTGIIVLGITGNSDHGTITNCRINHNVFFGIHARELLLSLNISNCDIWANIGDGVGFTSGYTLGTASVEPFDINNKPAPVAPNTLVAFGVVIDGGRNCVIDGNTIAHNIVNLGYGGCQLTTISGNFFRTDGVRTTNHILEYFNVYGTNTGPNTYNNAQNTICNNVFAGNLIPSPASNFIQKPINFYTTLNAYNVVASEYMVKNNTRTTGFNQFNFSPSIPDNVTYIMDPNYDEFNVSLLNSYGGRVLQLSTAMFGTSWNLNVNYPFSAPATYAPLSFQITPNYIGTDVPSIRCSGISYNSGTKTYTITSAGRYTFNDVAGGNTWIITSDNTSNMEFQPTTLFNSSYIFNPNIPYNLVNTNGGNIEITFPTITADYIGLTFTIYKYDKDNTLAITTASGVTANDKTYSNEVKVSSNRIGKWEGVVIGANTYSIFFSEYTV